MTLATSFISGVVFPLHELAKRHHSVALRRELERTQWLSAQQLQVQQTQRLKSFLARVGSSVPYYRDLFAQRGLDPARVAGVEDLQRLPLLTKATIREHTEAMKADGATRLVRFNTGGSSGDPLVFYKGMGRI
jgi:phenylacetate-CoA ligase